jgi:hypothetical protein
MMTNRPTPDRVESGVEGEYSKVPSNWVTAMW